MICQWVTVSVKKCYNYFADNILTICLNNVMITQADSLGKNIKLPNQFTIKPMNAISS